MLPVSNAKRCSVGNLLMGTTVDRVIDGSLALVSQHVIRDMPLPRPSYFNKKLSKSSISTAANVTTYTADTQYVIRQYGCRVVK